MLSGSSIGSGDARRWRCEILTAEPTLGKHRVGLAVAVKLVADLLADRLKLQRDTYVGSLTFGLAELKLGSLKWPLLAR